MKKKFVEIIRKMEEAIRRNPVEVILSVLYCVTACLQYKDVVQTKSMLPYFPVVFLASYMLNYLTTFNKTFRLVYFLSVSFFIPFLFFESEIASTPYIVTLAITLLVYLVCSRKKENLAFVENGLSFFGSLLSAFLLSLIALLLSISVYYSIQYIFEVFEGSDSAFMNYISFIAFLLVMPLLFLMFNQYEAKISGNNKVFDVLLNYVLSPALLIYAVILYLYFIKVAVLWSLPKGAVAYIVISFASAAFILKGLQPFLQKQYYNWFYNRVGLYVIPALVMFWIGTTYRVNQYGFTEARVYLVLIGCFLTLCSFLFFSKRLGRYLYMAYLAIGLLALFTYVPHLTAKNVGILSQTTRMINAAKALGMYTPEGKLSETPPTVVTGTAEEYRTLYQSYIYLHREEGQPFMLDRYGIGLASILLDSFIPEEYRDYALYGEERKISDRSSFDVYSKANQDISGYKTLYSLHKYMYDDESRACARVKNDSLKVWDEKGELLLNKDLGELLTEQLKKIGIESTKGLTEKSFDVNDPRLFRYEQDSVLFLFDEFEFYKYPELKVSRIGVACYLK